MSFSVWNQDLASSGFDFSVTAKSVQGAIENVGGLTLRGFGVAAFEGCRFCMSLTRFTSPDEEAEEFRITTGFAGVSDLGWRSAAASDAGLLISWAAELSKTAEVLVTLPG